MAANPGESPHQETDRSPAKIDRLQSPQVSVIIPAYKVAPFIEETLNSVLSQTFKNYEIIVINDGSPDTPDLEKALGGYLDKINYVKQDNKGAGAARNAGLRLARGQYVAFLDGDDAWSPEYLEEQLKLIHSDGGYDLVYANALLVGDSPWTGKTYMDRDPSTGPATFEALVGERCLVITSGVLARREPIIEVGLFDESLRNSQDFDLWVRLAKRAHARITYQRKVLLRHRAHAGSLASDGIKSVEGELKVLHKVSEWPNLTPSERKTLEATIALRTASVEVDRGKRALLAGEFDAAARSFRSANDYYHRWKLRMALILLRIGPRVLRRLYRFRTT
jgi:glycosyltransferase involved in cell wall biosynthesis